MINTVERSNREEIMDDFNMQGEELEKTLLDLDKVNKWLGGNKITHEGVEKLLKHKKFNEPVRIVDIGCGNGSILKEIAQRARKRNIKMKLLGIDANSNAVDIARKNLSAYPEVSFEAMDVFSDDFKALEADIFLCTLTLHHFHDDEIKKLLKTFIEAANIGIVINDLQRSRSAYYLFQVFCTAFGIREINRKDGLTSILRSFKRRDLEEYGRNLPVKRQEISWKWAFRFQLILYKV